MNEPIRIWHFRDAPEEWQFSDNGGDEDWVAFVPATFTYGPPLFLDEGSTFGCCSVNRYVVDGGVVLIGCHA